ncbi:unnamed protein product [Rotaria sp. Silwood2]|nr:unnamed protein product [Rotaria sp. Silwood2]CAF2771798.1 unnamed protein product [Rotaria sp. Silwood2]CAF2988854.1 unnamed protein product [Rotaria sp. Silwood2]CAF3178134.1 unnamed protein product [Rotaria sp. Silwood2]CAF3962579.1 unnamed protein product [Rotaria sp. Silwood2]
MLEHERLPVAIEEDGSVCVTACCPSPVQTRLTCLYPVSVPTWTDLLPGRYNLTCRIRLRRQPIDHNSNTVGQVIGRPLLDIDLFGDRAHLGGKWVMLKRPWFEQEYSNHGDDRWFSTVLINDFVLDDISNVYLGMRVDEYPPVFFTIWIDTFQLNFVGIN